MTRPASVFAFVSCFLVTVAVASLAASPKDPVDGILSRMNDAARTFTTLTTNVKFTSHTAVIDEDTNERGSMILKKIRASDVAARIDFTEPDRKTILVDSNRAQIYTPKDNEVQVYKFGSNGEQVYRFLMLGFGLSGTELAHDYDMRAVGQETIAGKQTTKLELLPKSAEVKKVISRIELWIPNSGDPYPPQEKVYEKTAGDYRLAVYTDLKINAPVPADVLKLNTKPGVKFVYPQK